MGSFVDDVVVHKLSENDYLIVINAGTREKDVAWVRKTVGHMPSIHISDYSDMYTQLAIQGPKAQATLAEADRYGSECDQELLVYVGEGCGLV